MIKREEYEDAAQKTREYLAEAGIFLTPEEANAVEVADFGLNNLLVEGLQLITYINTKRVCAKELVLMPGQTCPEHLHPTVDGEPGKEETFRCRRGQVFLYVEGEPTPQIAAEIPPGKEAVYTVFRQIALGPGEQYTIYPDTKHWFQAGPDGAVVSEFSTRSTDEADLFTDPAVLRTPEVGP